MISGTTSRQNRLYKRPFDMDEREFYGTLLFYHQWLFFSPVAFFFSWCVRGREDIIFIVKPIGIMTMILMLYSMYVENCFYFLSINDNDDDNGFRGL